MKYLVEAAMLAFRTIFMYALTVAVMRFSGKRAVGDMAPFDLAITVVIGSAAAIPLEEESISLWKASVPMIMLGVMGLAVSWVNVRFRRMEAMTQGVPTLLIQKGHIIEKNMVKERVTRADLEIAMREQGITNLGDIEEARLEPSGNISIIPKVKARPLTAQDLPTLTEEQVDVMVQHALTRLRGQFEELVRSGAQQEDHSH